MGLTISYSLRSLTKNPHRLAEQMRHLALDLPFEDVAEIVALEGDDCDFEKQRGKVDEDRLWLLIQATQHVRLPWSERISVSVKPSRIIAFSTWPGPGSEAANFGLCQYPHTIEVTFRPKDDALFDRQYEPCGPGSQAWHFSWKHWHRWLRRKGHESYLSPDDEQFLENRKVYTRLFGWRWSSFCKTQYASNPNCGGIPNFLRCHISVVTLLERIAALPTLKVEIDDEGQYGPSKFSDDWREARAAGREPTYVWHEGKYDVKTLASEVGDWNQMIAAFSGAMKDALGGSSIGVDSAIGGFPTFEHWEFKGSQDERLQPFLEAMKKLAQQDQETGAA